MHFPTFVKDEPSSRFQRKAGRRDHYVYVYVSFCCTTSLPKLCGEKPSQLCGSAVSSGLADLCWAFSLVCGQLLVGWWLVADLGWPHSYLCLEYCRPRRLSSPPCILSSAIHVAQAHSHGGLGFPRAARGQG